MTQVAIYNEKGTLIGNSLRALGPWESGLDIPDSVKQGICDQLNGMKARGELDAPEPEIPGPDMASLKEQASLRAGVESEASTPDLPEEPIVHKVTLEGVDGEPADWFPVEMDFSSEAYMGLLIRADCGTIDSGDRRVMRSYTGALLFCGLVRSEKDERPYFESYDAAKAFARNPKNKNLVGELFQAIIKLNPTAQLPPSGAAEPSKKN